MLLLFVAYLAWGADNHEFKNWVFQDINSIVAILAFNTIIGLGMGIDWCEQILGKTLYVIG